MSETTQTPPSPTAPKTGLSYREPLDERLEMIKVISNRLWLALTLLLAVMIAGAYLVSGGYNDLIGATSWMVLLTGIIGGFISLQKRLKTLGHDDLLLLARSWVYVVLSPLVGGILALLLYVLFISGLVEGDLFPTFVPDVVDPTADAASAGSLMDLFAIHAQDHQDYAKLLFWCFLAGYSEEFVTNIISRFESAQSEKSDN